MISNDKYKLHRGPTRTQSHSKDGMPSVIDNGLAPRKSLYILLLPMREYRCSATNRHTATGTLALFPFDHD